MNIWITLCTPYFGQLSSPQASRKVLIMFATRRYLSNSALVLCGNITTSRYLGFSHSVICHPPLLSVPIAYDPKSFRTCVYILGRQRSWGTYLTTATTCLEVNALRFMWRYARHPSGMCHNTKMIFQYKVCQSASQPDASSLEPTGSNRNRITHF
jgi:hypothetical protein